MTRILAISLTLTPTLAHPGDHGGLGVMAAIDQTMTQSLHIAGALSVLLMPVLVHRLARGRT